MIISVQSLDYFVSGNWCTASLITTSRPDYTELTKEIINNDFALGSDGRLRIDLTAGYLLVEICAEELYHDELRLALVQALFDEQRIASPSFSMIP